MIRVGNVIEEGRWGGPHRRIIEVALRLGPLGFATTVVHPMRDDQEFVARLSAAGIAATRIDLVGPRRGWKNLLAYILKFIPDVLRLRGVFREGQFDLIHCSGGAWQIKGVVAANLARIPVVWHLNDTSMPSLIRRLFRPMARWGASGFIVAGKRVYEYYGLERWPEKPVFEIQPPVDTALFNPARVTPDPEIQRLPGRKILVIANVNPGKGLHVLIQAASILKEQFSEVSFVVVGAVYESQQQFFNELVDRTRELGVGDRFFFVGSRKNVAEALAAADISVCSSLYEAGPMVVWEAMSMERPIISTDVGDVARFIQDGESGIVVEPGNAQALAAGIVRYLENPKFGRSCGERARRMAVDKLDIRMCADKHAHCYRSMLSVCARR
jgi:glycosyltransferase involved in cell wall biosynthesis